MRKLKGGKFMTTLECLKLFALMSSPMYLALVVWGVWDWIEAKCEKMKNHEK